MVEPNIRGTEFVSARAFVLARFGIPGWAAALARLREAERQPIASAVSVGWYPLSLYARLVRAIDEVHGCGDSILAVQLGRFEAERDVSTVHRVVLRGGSPAYAIETIAAQWARTQDTGAWTIQAPADTYVDATLDGWGHVDRPLCRALGGYVARILELVGARSVVVEHPFCRGVGDRTCAFRARWSAAAELSDGASGPRSAGPRRSSPPEESGPRPILDGGGRAAPTSRSAVSRSS